MNKTLINSRLEDKYIQDGYKYVVGLDEVGRGSWAGPVVVGAFVFKKSSVIVEGVNDSKKISLKKRIGLYDCLISENLYTIGTASVEEIDQLNIVEATRLAMIRSINKLQINNFFCLIDGYFKRGFDFNHKLIKSGDSKHYSIACASIIAKVYRDNMMTKLSKKYSKYGFDTNVGYGTKKHREGLEEFGVCAIHRKSYKPVKKHL